jgi:hypothetical protein
MAVPVGVEASQTLTEAHNRDTLVSLCDLTLNGCQPWIEAGYQVLAVDPQHGITTTRDGVTRFAGTIEDAMPLIGRLIAEQRIVFVAGYPPCTDLAVSGAGWFKGKYEADKLFQAKAVAVAEQCRTIGRLSGAPWFVENPVSVLASVFGKPNYYFHPHEYTAYEPMDNYVKKTSLWTGGGFIMPQPARDGSLGAPDERIHKAPPGPERANFRSATPMGFARAVFDANHQPALGAVA